MVLLVICSIGQPGLEVIRLDGAQSNPSREMDIESSSARKGKSIRSDGGSVRIWKKSIEAVHASHQELCEG